MRGNTIEFIIAYLGGAKPLSAGSELPPPPPPQKKTVHCMWRDMVVMWFSLLPPKVRAATVFALGTYVLNMSEDGTSEMRITIDQMVGSALLGLINDGSSVVRKVS